MKQLVLFLFCLSTFTLFSQNWQQIRPKGGYFKEFTFSKVGTHIIFAGSDDGGIWKSQDNGQTWTLLTESFPNMTWWVGVNSSTD